MNTNPTSRNFGQNKDGETSIVTPGVFRFQALEGCRAGFSRCGEVLERRAESRDVPIWLGAPALRARRAPRVEKKKPGAEPPAARIARASSRTAASMRGRPPSSPRSEEGLPRHARRSPRFPCSSVRRKRRRPIAIRTLKCTA